MPRTRTGPAAVSCRQNVSAVALSAEQQQQRPLAAAGDGDPGQPGVRVVQPQVAAWPRPRCVVDVAAGAVTVGCDA